MTLIAAVPPFFATVSQWQATVPAGVPAGSVVSWVPLTQSTLCGVIAALVSSSSLNRVALIASETFATSAASGLVIRSVTVTGVLRGISSGTGSNAVLTAAEAAGADSSTAARHDATATQVARILMCIACFPSLGVDPRFR